MLLQICTIYVGHVHFMFRLSQIYVGYGRFSTVFLLKIFSVREINQQATVLGFSYQKIVGNSLQPIGVIITGNLFIKAPC